MNVKGTCENRFLKVKDLFNELHASDREIWSSFSVYKDGKPLIDLWGGYKDQEKTSPWEKNTLATVWSTTKGIAAITIAYAYEKGLIDYE